MTPAVRRAINDVLKGDSVRLTHLRAVACTARSKRTGRPCRQAAIRYTNRCRMHCGMTPDDARALRDVRIATAALLAIGAGDLAKADDLIAMLPSVSVGAILAAEEERAEEQELDVDALLGEPTPEDLAKLLEAAEET